MNKMRGFLLVVAWMLGSSLAMAKTKPSPQGDVWVQKGKRIAKSTFLALKKELGRAMKKGGPVAAVKVCNVKAMPVTAAMAKKQGVGIARISHRARNSLNAANAKELALIARYEQQKKARKPLRSVVLHQGKQRVFYAPIVLNNGLCLLCHGTPKTQIPSTLYQLIRKLYPKGKATGFAMGDIRGMWKITMKK